MPAPDTLNARIALAKGWTWHEEDFFLAPDFGNVPELRTHWLFVEGEPAIPPDWVGKLKGVAELMRELNKDAYPDEWKWSYSCAAKEADWPACYLVARIGPWGASTAYFESPPDRPGDCIGDAWLSVFGKEGHG